VPDIPSPEVPDIPSPEVPDIPSPEVPDIPSPEVRARPPLSDGASKKNRSFVMAGAVVAGVIVLLGLVAVTRTGTEEPSDAPALVTGTTSGQLPERPRPEPIPEPVDTAPVADSPEVVPEVADAGTPVVAPEAASVAPASGTAPKFKPLKPLIPLPVKPPPAPKEPSFDPSGI
jgi:hypothetical protein